MGRRKIDIRPIKDDRNRSVTFLKRKGGLFKKAYELSVLCSVDVAVIIFGNNKKLYEFSSGDINDTIGRFQYYAGAHEHKGPQDFQGKGGDDEEEEDEPIGSPRGDSHSPPEPSAMAHNLHNQPGLQHIRHSTPSASPPMPNGAFLHRVSTPQPQGLSRPSSRTSDLRRMSSNLSIHQQQTPPQAPMTQPNYAYTPNPPFYNPQQAAAMQQHRQPPYIQAPQMQYHTPPTHPQVQQAYMQDQRRQSMPPALPPPHIQAHPPPPPQPSPRPPQHHQEHHQESLSRKPSPQANQGAFTSPPLPQPKPLAAHAKSHSIFTPIEDSRSLLAQHWGGPAGGESSYGEYIKQEGNRSQSIDVAAMTRHRLNGHSPQPPQPPPFSQHPAGPRRTNSSTSLSGFPPSRSNTTQSDAKRPRLKVQIPSEQSDGGEATADDSPKETPSATVMHQGKGVVLPPPSPSTNNPLLSAGASGPPNPFARPAPPISTNPHVNRETIETPLSALPSRVMDGNMLPSPSDLWQSAWFCRTNTDMLPSPLNFQPTPIGANGPSFRDDLDADRKRRAEGDVAEGAVKRPRT